MKKGYQKLFIYNQLFINRWLISIIRFLQAKDQFQSAKGRSFL